MRLAVTVRLRFELKLRVRGRINVWDLIAV